MIADALSRIEMNALLSGQPPTVDFTAIADAQANDPQIRSLQSSPSSTLVVEAVPLANSTNPLYCDTSTGTKRPLVPQRWRRTVFDSLHGLSHPGIRATQKLITSRFVWPGNTPTFVAGLVHVFNANAQISKSTQQLHSLPSPHQMLALTSSTSIRLDHFNHLEDTPTSSPASTASPAGPKPSLSPPSQLKLLPRPFWLVGSLALVYLRRLLLIVDVNLNHNCGQIS